MFNAVLKQTPNHISIQTQLVIVRVKICHTSIRRPFYAGLGDRSTQNGLWILRGSVEENPTISVELQMSSLVRDWAADVLSITVCFHLLARVNCSTPQFVKWALRLNDSWIVYHDGGYEYCMPAFWFFGLISIMILCVALWPLPTEDHS